MIKEILLALNFLVMPDVTLDPYVINIAKDIRRVTDAQITITSNCRSKQYNSRVGGKINSRHLVCKAIDIRSSGLKRKTINEIKSLTKSGRYDIVEEYNPPHIHIELNEWMNTITEINDILIDWPSGG